MFVALQTVKDNCNPTYDETFEYVISMAELHSKHLEVTVLTQKTWKSPVMGQVKKSLHLHVSTSWGVLLFEEIPKFKDKRKKLYIWKKNQDSSDRLLLSCSFCVS